MSCYSSVTVQAYELHDNPLQRRQRRAKLVLVYAMCDPRGWDAGRLDMAPGELRAAWAAIKEVHAAQQKAGDPGAGVAGPVSDRADAPSPHRELAGRP